MDATVAIKVASFEFVVDWGVDATLLIVAVEMSEEYRSLRAYVHLIIIIDPLVLYVNFHYKIIVLHFPIPFHRQNSPLVLEQLPLKWLAPKWLVCKTRKNTL
uniref:Uncharacterized protein n=1 Tax=Romanomermis culicivorax TaxID=13658 RepID=A0A915L6B4_ROMCU